MKASLSKSDTLMRKCYYHRMSQCFRPVNETSFSKPVPKDSCRSQKLMIDNGLVRNSAGGIHLLPITVRVLEKVCKIVDNVLSRYGCQKLQMPTLTAAGLWNATGRLKECGPEILRVKDRCAKDFILSPTHEEAICDLVSNWDWSYKHLPLKLYQITSKFRDEMRPKHGLLRAKEFIMKDLYTFDVDKEAAKETYKQINEAYETIFKKIGLPVIKVRSDSGVMGGDLSHEYHIISDIGEDLLGTCSDCKAAFNCCMLDEGESEQMQCPSCKSSSTTTTNGIEVGHAFLLGQKYSKRLQCKFNTSAGKKEVMEMGCYGIGITRLLGATVEYFAVDNQIRWPRSLAPYSVAIIPPKAGSKEEAAAMGYLPEVLEKLERLFPGDVLLDDRASTTIGKRLQDIKRLGIPYAVILGKAVTDAVPSVEIADIMNDTNKTIELSHVGKMLQAG